MAIDCQTNKKTISCEYCIVNESCNLRKELKEKIGLEEEPLQLVVNSIDRSLIFHF